MGGWQLMASGKRSVDRSAFEGGEAGSATGFRFVRPRSTIDAADVVHPDWLQPALCRMLGTALSDNVPVDRLTELDGFRALNRHTFGLIAGRFSFGVQSSWALGSNPRTVELRPTTRDGLIPLSELAGARSPAAWCAAWEGSLVPLIGRRLACHPATVSACYQRVKGRGAGPECTGTRSLRPGPRA